MIEDPVKFCTEEIAKIFEASAGPGGREIAEAIGREFLMRLWDEACSRAAKAEREACLRVCDKFHRLEGAVAIADAIRTRGEFQERAARGNT
jgi:hypothetical protein